jgi:hypothetical protein
MDNINNWPQPDYPHYYFYGVFNNLEHTKYVLYDCNCKTKLFLKTDDYQKLYEANRSNNNQVLTQVSENPIYNEFPKIVPLNTKFCLKIYINSTLFPKFIDNLKKLIDRIVVFCNAIGVITTNKPLVNGNGYDPTDDLLYYCEIEKVDNEETKDNIIFYVCPICESNNENEDNYCCKEKRNNINNFPGFREGDEIEIVREEESINENQDEKEVPKKNNPNNFPGFKKEDEIVDEKENQHKNNQTLGLTNNERDQQNRNEGPFIVNVDRPTSTVTIHKNTCPYIRNMGHIVPGNGEMVRFPTPEEAVKYVRNNYGHFRYKRLCKKCFPNQKIDF